MDLQNALWHDVGTARSLARTRRFFQRFILWFPKVSLCMCEMRILFNDSTNCTIAYLAQFLSCRLCSISLFAQFLARTFAFQMGLLYAVSLVFATPSQPVVQQNSRNIQIQKKNSSQLSITISE
jgi:hypothetical protein